ncbi:MAG: histidine phosphatase family protein [Halorientalis sp.]
MRRRQLLTLLAGATAGCAGQSPGGQGTETEEEGTPTPTPTATGSPTPTPTDTPTPTPTETPSTVERLFAALAEGGYTIYFRHALTEDTTDMPPPRFDIDDCSTQRRLSMRGRAQARAIGDAFDQLGIPVGRVLSSEYCRCRNTAELAFGEYRTTEDLNSGVRNEGQRRMERILTPPEPGTNTVLVSHSLPYETRRTLLGEWHLTEGDSATFMPDADPSEALVHVTRSSTWLDAAEG